MTITHDYQQLVRQSILDEATFVKATFSGVQHGQTNPWLRLIVRPVMLKSGRHLQFSYIDKRQDVTRNYTAKEVKQQLEAALALPFSSYSIQSTTGDYQVQISKKGKPIIHRHAARRDEITLEHDREKHKPLDASTPDAYLQAVGIMTEDGKIKASMQSKFKQINEFLRLLDETGAFDRPDAPLHIVDFGCGNAYLTFATYHYATQVRGLDCSLTGVDVNRRLLENHAEKVKALGWQKLTFEATPIADYAPPVPPELVIALHACDTATDDALAQGLRMNSRAIVCAPCCQHHLQAQLREQPTPAPFSEMMRYGLMHERMGDLLTDTFRALILRLHGYKVEMVQFVDSEHTPKNLMLRAVKVGQTDEARQRLEEEYNALKAFWGVTPYLETVLSNLES